MFQVYTNLIFTFLSSFVLTSLLIPFFTKCALKFKIVDSPDGKLKKHDKATPYLGGVAIFLATFCVLLFMLNINQNIVILFSSLALLMLLGLIDDIYIIKPLIKFLGQTLSILLLLVSNIYLKDFFLSKYLTIFLIMFWNLTLINAFNLIDVMDGLCTTVAIFATMGFIIISILFNQLSVCILLFAFLGALISFLFFNFPPARIYLGDAGSMFIGGFLGVVPFLLKWPSNFTAFFSSICLLLIPILELISLIIIRTYKRIPFYLGSPDHFSIYLRVKGWSKKNILTYVACINILLVVIVVLNILSYLPFDGVVFLLSLVLCAWIILLLI